MGRLGTAEEVADVIVVTASPVPIGSMAVTSRLMVWSNPIRTSTAGHSDLSLWNTGHLRDDQRQRMLCSEDLWRAIDPPTREGMSEGEI